MLPITIFKVLCSSSFLSFVTFLATDVTESNFAEKKCGLSINLLAFILRTYYRHAGDDDLVPQHFLFAAQDELLQDDRHLDGLRPSPALSRGRASHSHRVQPEGGDSRWRGRGAEKLGQKGIVIKK